MSSQELHEFDNLCTQITIKNTRCSRKAVINEKCTFHNNLLKIKTEKLNVYRKLNFELCNGYNYISERQLSKCRELGEKNIHNKYYCEFHSKNYKLEKPEECIICMDVICEKEEVPLHCGHWFHIECIKHISKFECPMCRQPFNNNETNRIMKLISIVFTDDNGGQFKLKIPEIIAFNEKYGLSYIQLIYLQIKEFLKTINVNFNSETTNQIMLNIFKNDDYLNVSMDVYNMFIPIYENERIVYYKVKETINFDEDNFYTLNYDNFRDIVEQLYHSLKI